MLLVSFVGFQESAYLTQKRQNDPPKRPPGRVHFLVRWEISALLLLRTCFINTWTRRCSFAMGVCELPWHIPNTLKKHKTHSKHNQQKDNTRSKHKTRPNTTNNWKKLYNYNPHKHYQRTNTSLPNNIPHLKYTLNIQIHPLSSTSLMHSQHKNTSTFMCLKSIAGVPSRQALLGFLITAPHLYAFLL